MEGEVMVEKIVEEEVEILRSKISTALDDMIGEIELPVSAYSAIKKDGVPMYKRARKAAEKGEEVTDVPKRTMLVHEAQLSVVSVGGGRAVAEITFVVGSGTYIRSLAEELGRRLNYPATLQNLRRTKVGKFHVQDASQL
jgi:tRNA pseudouridine55 synthase